MKYVFLLCVFIRSQISVNLFSEAMLRSAQLSNKKTTKLDQNGCKWNIVVHINDQSSLQLYVQLHFMPAGGGRRAKAKRNRQQHLKNNVGCNGKEKKKDLEVFDGL